MRAPRRQGLCLTAVALGLAALSGPSVAAGDEPSRRGPHSSDGVVGPTAAPLSARERRTAYRANESTYRVAPGLRFTRWDETDRRGRFRAYLLRANLERPGLSLRYAGPGRVAAREPLTRLLARDGAVAGVNGDFFDIGDTGAPLGVGVDQTEVRHGPAQGWTSSFFVVGRSGAQIGERPVTTSVVGRPGLSITNVNSPHIHRQGIGLYTPAWGTAPGRAVTEGAARRDLRQVVVRSGRVVSNTRTLSRGDAIRGRLLVGRGQGADDLRRLRVGAEVRFRTTVVDRPRVAISGSGQLLRDGRVLTTDDGELHPRTAVGIDQDTGRVLLLVVDGRQDHSRGLTLVELAELMRELGAEDALNLDGGGSTTMVARRPSGRVRVANSPSDGRQRPVPNGLELLYREP